MMKKNLLLLSIVISVFFLANYLVIDSLPLWRDEAFSVTIARMGILESTARSARDVHPPLHLYLLHGWMLLFGDSESAVRSLSLVFSLITILLSYGIGLQLYGSKSMKSVFLATLVGSSPFLLYQSVEARSYAMLFCAELGVIYAWFLARDQKEYSKKDLLFVAFALLGLYSHVVFIPALFAIFIWQFATRSVPLLQHLLKVGVSYLIILVGFLPWIGVVIKQLLQVDSQGFWLEFHPVSDLLNSFESIFTTPSVHPSLHMFTPLILFLVSTIAFAFWCIGSFSTNEHKQLPHRLGMLVWTTLGVLFMISFIVPLYYARYLSFLAPVLLIVIFDAILQLRKSYSLQPVIVFYLILFLGNIYIYFGNIQQNPNLKAAYPDAIAYILKQEPSALILHPHGYTLHSFRYYAPKMGIQPGFLYDPARELPHFEGLAAFSDPQYYDAELSTVEDQFIWTPFLWEDERFFTLLAEAGFELVETKEFVGGLKLWLWKQ